MNPPSNLIVMRTIWEQSEGRHVFLPEMTPGGWYEQAPSVPEAEGLGTALSYRSKDHDLYFTPLRFNGSQRRRGLIGRPGVIFADLDGGLKRGCMEPSVLIESSPGHYHGYWFLLEPVDPAQWERHAKGWTQALDADPGGWDLTQVLRVPGTLNHKYSPPHVVRTVTFNPHLRYDIDEFPAVGMGEVLTGGLSAAPVPDKGKRDSYLARAFAINNVPLGARYWLTATPDEIANLGRIDRSKVMWQVERQLIENGFTPQEVFQLMWYSPVNKWGTPAELWREVLKAAGV
jgi:hypothetical protein